MNETLQKCNKCGAVNVNRDKGWIRLHGTVSDGPVPAGRIMSANGPSDFCPACSKASTVVDLLTLLAPPAAPKVPAVIKRP